MLVELSKAKVYRETGDTSPAVVLNLGDFADSYDGQTFTMTVDELEELLHNIAEALNKVKC